MNTVETVAEEIILQRDNTLELRKYVIKVKIYVIKTVNSCFTLKIPILVVMFTLYLGWACPDWECILCCDKYHTFNTI